MKIPTDKYTLESFMEFIVKNRDDVFGEKQERKWLKAYLLYILKDWSTIFSGLNMERRLSFDEVIKSLIENYYSRAQEQSL